MTRLREIYSCKMAIIEEFSQYEDMPQETLDNTDFWKNNVFFLSLKEFIKLDKEEKQLFESLGEMVMEMDLADDQKVAYRLHDLHIKSKVFETLKSQVTSGDKLAIAEDEMYDAVKALHDVAEKNSTAQNYIWNKLIPYSSK
jgi:hypothetical protein